MDRLARTLLVLAVLLGSRPAWLSRASGAD
jgi:hypothetical protein